MQRRQVTQQIKCDLEHKMVLLAGPRQVGKTTIAKNLIKEYSGVYYNWDEDGDRDLIIQSKLNFSKKLWVFDELHKYRSWRNWLKGKYDNFGKEHKILVTGSARLDLYSRGGDSLQGRYFFQRLHPFTLAELLETKLPEDLNVFPLMQFDPDEKTSQDIINKMLELGSFPEPFLANSKQLAKRWRLSYGARLVREDIRDLENLVSLDKVELLYKHLPYTVGSPLSINSLREDLEVSFESVRDWIKILEKNYACFRLAPLGGTKILKNIRAVKKEQKLYMWDFALIEDPAARFENFIACHLLKFVHWLEDIHGENVELRYFRDSRGHEVDFIVLKDSKPWMAIEVKKSAQSLDPNLKYLLERVKIPFAFQVHLEGDEYYRVPDINGARTSITPAWRFLGNLA